MKLASQNESSFTRLALPNPPGPYTPECIHRRYATRVGNRGLVQNRFWNYSDVTRGKVLWAATSVTNQTEMLHCLLNYWTHHFPWSAVLRLTCEHIGRHNIHALQPHIVSHDCTCTRFLDKLPVHIQKRISSHTVHYFWEQARNNKYNSQLVLWYSCHNEFCFFCNITIIYHKMHKLATVLYWYWK